MHTSLASILRPEPSVRPGTAVDTSVQQVWLPEFLAFPLRPSRPRRQPCSLIRPLAPLLSPSCSRGPLSHVPVISLRTLGEVLDEWSWGCSRREQRNYLGVSNKTKTMRWRFRIRKTTLTRLKRLPTAPGPLVAWPLTCLPGFPLPCFPSQLHVILTQLLEDPQAHHDFSCFSLNAHKPLPIKQIWLPPFSSEKTETHGPLTQPRLRDGRPRIQSVWLQTLSFSLYVKQFILINGNIQVVLYCWKCQKLAPKTWLVSQNTPRITCLCSFV